MSRRAMSWPKLYMLLTVACCLFALSTVEAQATGAISHQPIYQHTATEPLVMNATVSSAIDVERVVLFYRQSGEEGYIDEEMDRTAEGWFGEIPLGSLSPEGIEYFISATLVDATILTFPENDPEGAPIFVQIVTPAEPEEITEQIEVTPVPEEVTVPGREEAILVFSPLPGSRVPFDDVLIAASLFNLDSVDISSVRLYLDGQDVTARSEVGADLLLYEAPTMFPGIHRVRIEVKTLDGQLVEPKLWSFEVERRYVEEVERVERELTYRGRFNGGYSYDEIDGGTPLKIGMTTAAFSGEWRGWRFKTDLKLTSEEDPFKQPRNRYRFTLNSGKIFSLNLGDFNSRISRFTLDGKRVRGLDADIRLGWLNIHVVKGKLDRKIQGSLGEGESYVFEGVDLKEDSTTYNLNRKGYAFQKDIFAGRLSFGSGRIFQLGFNWLKAKDDIQSVDRIFGDAKIAVPDSSDGDKLDIPGGSYTYDELFSLINNIPNYKLELPNNNWAGDAPQDNIVIGSDIKFSLFQRKIGIEGGWAFSMLNRDIWEGAISLAEMDTIIDDSVDNKISGEFDLGKFPDPADYEKYFTINQNMVPLIPIDPDSTQLADNPLKAILNMPSLSYNFRATANLLNNRFGFEYIKVGPEFNSLGNPYIQKNIKEYTVSDRISFFRNRFLLNLMYKRQDDDILRKVEYVTTTNTIAANVGIYPGSGLPSIVMSYRSQERDNGKKARDMVREDSVFVDLVFRGVNYDFEDLRDFTNTTNIALGISHRVNLLGAENSVAVNYIMLDREDQYDDRPSAPFFETSGADTNFFDSTFVSPNLSSDVVNISFVTDYPFPLKTTAVLSINNSTFGKKGKGDIYYYGDQGITSFTLNGTYDMFKGRLKLLGGLDYTTGSGNEEFSRLGFRGGFNYRITDVLRIRFDGGLRSKNIKGESKKSTLMRAFLNYTF